MKIKAVGTTIVEWDPAQARMVIINPGESDELSDGLAQQYIDGGRAKAAGRTASTPKVETTPAETKPVNPLAAARKAYKAAFGKGPSPKWDVATIEAKIAEQQAENAGEADEAPPAE